MNVNTEMLRKHGLKVTPSRSATLEAIVSSETALSHSDIEGLRPDLDRVTLYRTLQIFESKGLIHKVIDDTGSVRYSSCKNGCNHHKAHDLHLHFRCEKCDRTICLEEVEIQKPQLPQGYQLHQYFSTATGVCVDCH